MKETPSSDDRHYRRGVVLGLTMAEILLLLTFLLMLLLTAELGKQRDQVREFERARNEALEELELLRPIAEAMRAAGVDQFDMTKEYVRIRQDLARAEERLRESEAAFELMEKAREQFPKEASSAEIIERFRKAARIGQEIEKSGGDAAELVASAATCKAELSSCQGQTAYLNRRLNEQIGGFGLPPCWADSAGRIQYIFDAHLTDTGIVLSDNKVAGREKDQAALPLQSIRLGIPSEQDAFGRSVRPLLDWSNEQQCRFYVRLYDRFETGGRERYKDLRRAVEGYFYILDAR